MNQQGLQLLDAGNPNEALQVLTQAQTIYKKLNNTTGIYGTLINQSLAYKQMGQYHSACTRLTQVLSLDTNICRRWKQTSQEELKTSLERSNNIIQSQKIIALHNLGNILRLLGQLEASELVLKQGLPHSSLLSSEDRHSIELALANTYQSLYKQAYNQFSFSSDSASQANALNKAQQYAEAALANYQFVAESPSKDQIRTQLNTLQLLQNLGQSKSPALVRAYNQSQDLISPYIKDLISADFSQFSTNEAINLQLKLSYLLADVDPRTIPSSDNNLSLAYNLAKTTLRHAESFGDRRLISQAYGVFGKLYVQSDQLDDATQVLTKALKLAQVIQDDHLAYQWSWQIAQIHQQQGEKANAIAAYDTTIKHLDQVRTTLISANSDLQFNYKESVEPVYKNYMGLLLSSDTPDFELILETKQQLQVAELENYLKCSKLTAPQTNNQQNSRYDATVHIFELNGQIEVIAQTQNGIFRHQPNSSLVQQKLFNLLENLDTEVLGQISIETIQQNTQALYRQLITPFKEHIPDSGDLLFVLDSTFQNLPINMLHDGHQYLIENYSVTNALNTQLKPIQPQNLEKLNVLFAGLSENSPSFNSPNVPGGLEALPEVKDELNGVTKFSNQITYLLNSEFTTDKLQSKLQVSTPIIHVASHGQFSSDPERTMILAFDGPIKAKQFHDLISERTELGQSSIELLILSACQTAKGDKRSTLGIAGLAVQAGSRNTLASLWLADSSATAELITLFYQGLKGGLSKPRALQQAQIQLMDSGYSHPYLWGNFILVGS
ncbi:CHAT domain-containing protein [Acaryochloris marina NIES-2412]|uniref:CHAT domain-containing protein n=1 Tax=Acaryochloris marina TaxID=155978 RepID=UPI00405A40A0